MKTIAFSLIGTMMIASGLMICDSSHETLSMIVGFMSIIFGTGVINYGLIKDGV